MMCSEEEIPSEEFQIDDDDHKQLLKEIKFIDEPEKLSKYRQKATRKGNKEKVVLKDLIGSIKSTRYIIIFIIQRLKCCLIFRNVDELKRKLLPTSRKRKETDASSEVKEKTDVEVSEFKKRKKKRVLEAPLHRQARTRIESRIAYGQSKLEIFDN